jgi:hypothetical protein
MGFIVLSVYIIWVLYLEQHSSGSGQIRHSDVEIQGLVYVEMDVVFVGGLAPVNSEWW